MEESPCIVTIGMPVYNGAAFVSKSLCSVLQQTFSGSMEFLVVDDCSTDGTADVVRQVAAAHPRGGIVRVIRHEENRGVGCARNTILDNAKGKYLYFIDSDDEIAPDCIEILLKQAEQHQAEAVYGSIYTVSIEGETVRGVETYVQKHLVFTQENELACYAYQDIHEHLRDYSVNILFLREFLEKHHLRFPPLRFHEDVIFSSNLVPLVTRAVLLPDVTYTYNIRVNSLSNYQGREHISLDEIKQFISIYTDVKEKARQSKGKPYYEARCLRSMTQMFFIVCGALKNRRVITPRLTDSMVRDAMKHPASFTEILRFKKQRLYNLAYYALGTLPAWLTVCLITIVAKTKRIL